MKMNRDLHEETHANTEVRALLRDAGEKLGAVLQDECITAETPREALSVMELAAEAIGVAVRRLEAAKRPVKASPGNDPTRQQGQFLAFIRE